MDNNKILIQVFLPQYEREFDVFIPINKRVGTIKQLVIKNLRENGLGDLSSDACFYSKDTGLIYDAQLLVKDTDLKNASRVVLI